MNSQFSKIALGVLGLFLLIPFSGTQAANFTESPTGLLELKEFHEPVSLYAPENFKKAEKRTLLIVIPTSQNEEQAASGWQELADRKNILVVCPQIAVRNEDVPYKVDEWILKLKSEIALRYNVQRVYLVGVGVSADYAAYLGLKHPQEFNAVAAVGGSWTGPFEKLTHLSENAIDQAPFFIALDEKDERVVKTQEKIKEMTPLGYAVRLVMLNKKGEEESDVFRNDMLGWLEEQVEKTAALRSVNVTKEKTWKDKVSKVKHDFFAL